MGSIEIRATQADKRVSDLGSTTGDALRASLANQTLKMHLDSGGKLTIVTSIFTL